MVEDLLSPQRLSPQRSPAPQLQQQPRPFRESCQNCADSKVRCSKDKPTCARCARRGTPCVYQQSRRAGRKVTSTAQAKQARRAAADALNENSQNTPPDTWAVTVDSISSLLSPPVSDTTSTVLPAQGASLDSHARSDSLSTLDPVSDHSDPTAWWSNELFKALCTESGTFLRGDDPDFAPDFTLDDDFSNLGDTGSTAIFDDTTLAALNLPTPGLDVTGNSPMAGYLSGPGSTTSSSVACNGDSCPAVISRLIPELFLSTRSTCERNQTQSSEPQSESLVDICARNKRISEAMDSMVECACSQDIHVLFLVGLCTSKVMSHYLGATQRDQMKSAAKRGGDSFNTSEDQEMQMEVEVDDTEAKIMAARMVLGELHRIQRLLARFSERLKRTEQTGDLSNNSTDSGGAARNEQESPFTRLMLQQLDHSLRGHLRYVFTCMSRVTQRA